MKLYKLTDQNGCTQGPTQWGEGVRHSIIKENRSKVLCSKGVLHAYKNINLALLLNPNHANIVNPLIWEAEGDIATEDWGKVGCWELMTVKRIDTPAWYLTHRQDVQVMFAILCAEAVLCHFEKYNPTDDRPRKAIKSAREYLKTKTASASARAAARDASAAANAAYAAYAAARDANAAANAASAAANAANAASAAANAAYAAARDASAAANAAYAAARDANAAANAAYAAARDDKELNFCELADMAVKEVMK